MDRPEDRARFRRLPEPVLPDDLVETVDTVFLPVSDGREDRDALIRAVGGPNA
jgi:hypothetical protein